MYLLLPNFYVPDNYCNNLGSSIPIFVPPDQILDSSSSVSESSSAEKSIAGLLSNADEQLRRAREYNNRIAQKMYTHTHTHTHTHTPDTIYTHTHQTQFTHTHRLAHTQRKLVNTTHTTISMLEYIIKIILKKYLAINRP